MIRFEVGSADVAATRFAVSPSFELALLVRTLVQAAPASPIARRFGAGFDRVREDPAVRTIAYLHGPKMGASFSAPPPAGMAQTIDEDLAVLRAVPEEVWRPELAEIRALRRPSAVVAAVLDDERFLDRFADGTARAWDALLAPHWSRVRAVLERDVRFRAERLSEVGWSGALAGMHHDIAWTGDAIVIDRPAEGTEVLGGRGLLLVPSVFLGQGLAVTGEAPWQPTIVYPSRGAGLVFEEAEASTDPLAHRPLGRLPQDRPRRRPGHRLLSAAPSGIARSSRTCDRALVRSCDCGAHLERSIEAPLARPGGLDVPSSRAALSPVPRPREASSIRVRSSIGDLGPAGDLRLESTPCTSCTSTASAAPSAIAASSPTSRSSSGRRRGSA